jgi:hypothetical protein
MYKNVNILPVYRWGSPGVASDSRTAAGIGSVFLKHKGEKDSGEKSKAAAFEIRPARVNLAWVRGAHSFTPSCS